MSLAMRFSAVLLLTLTMIGCGAGGPATKQFSGAVTFQGTPVAEGEIIFRSANGQPDVAPIKDGKYTAKTTLGAKTAEITATRETDKKDALGGPLKEQYIPAKYNTKTTLKLEVSGSTTTHDFTLE